MNHGLIPYIGGKHRLAKRLAEIIVGTGADTVVDVFAGSAAVLLAVTDSGIKKRVYNDIDRDLVNLFRVVADREQRRALFQLLRWTPPARAIFEEDHVRYVAGGFSFCAIADPVQRARATFYRHMFSFGGKVRSGGFSVSIKDEYHIKEVGRYRNTLKRLVRAGEFFRTTVIENQHYSDLIRFYGRRSEVCLFCDPPYLGTEDCYSHRFKGADHVFLAEQLNACKAAVVITYYDSPILRELYSPPIWTWTSIQATKNSQLLRGNKAKTDEWVITKKATPATSRVD